MITVAVFACQFTSAVVQFVHFVQFVHGSENSAFLLQIM
jgi:hypothetical protein